MAGLAELADPSSPLMDPRDLGDLVRLHDFSLTPFEQPQDPFPCRTFASRCVPVQLGSCRPQLGNQRVQGLDRGRTPAYGVVGEHGR